MATWTLFNKFKRNQFYPANDTDHQVDWKNDTIKIALVKAGAGSPAAGDNGCETWDDVKDGNSEVSGDGYTAGGISLGTLTATLDNGVVTITSAATISWSQEAGGFGDARYAVMYADKGMADTDKPVIAKLDLGGEVGNVAGPLTISLTGGEVIGGS